MAYDTTRCPQTLDEMRDYFYALIQRTPGTPATDWQFVLTNSGIPHNVYTPGMRADSSWPLFGLTQQWSSGPKARVFMPSATADDNGYYTRAMQYLDDAPGGGLVWSWYHVAGHDYAPVEGPGTGTGTPPGVIVLPPPAGLTEAQVQAMIDDSIAQALEALQPLHVGDRIALRCDAGTVLGVVNGGSTVEEQPITFIAKGTVHAWETLTIERGE